LFRLIPFWSWRVIFYACAASLLLGGAVVLTLRYWALPNIESYRGDLEIALTRAVGQKVTIGTIAGDWEGLRPQVSLARVTVFDKAENAALELGRVDTVLSWLTLFALEPRFHSVAIQSPELVARRDKRGTVSIAGIALSESQDGGGLSDWLLRQREILIRNATISWTDEMRDAPELVLNEVTFRLANDYHHHKFALKARAPAELAGLLDVRADLSGASVRAAKQWQGQVFVQLDYADLSRWHAWLPMPFEIARARGALRMWADVAGERLTGLIADVRLADVRARLAPELTWLELGGVDGRVAWRDWSGGFEVSTRGLTLTAADGKLLSPGNLFLRMRNATKDAPAQGEIRAGSVDLQAFAQIIEHLPVGSAVRTELARFAPRGTVDDLSGKWTGEWPPRGFEVKARFAGIGVNAAGSFPGLTNLTGTLEATEKRGALNLANKAMRIELPAVFAETHALETLTGQVLWTAADNGYDIRFVDIAFANADLAGTLRGNFKTSVESPGVADLNGELTRADARKVARYIPSAVRKSTRDWLERALVAGQSSDVKFRLKGDLAGFPFDQPASKGVFEIRAKAKGGVLDYAPGWPRLENISADIAFVANTMEIKASSATMLGAKIGRGVAVIADLTHANEVLEVNGDAEGQSAEFLRFISESPVAGMIDRFTDGMEAQGRGRLELKLTIPLRAINDSRVAGSYQFVANRLRVDPDMPALEQVNGRLEFTEASVRAQGIVAQVFAGPATIHLVTQDKGIAVTAAGRANIDALRKGAEVPELRFLSGATDWRSSLMVRGKQADFVIESGMQGVASSLPAPLAKSANDVVPLHFERRAGGGQQDRVQLSYGNVLKLAATRRRDGERMVFDRVAIGLGGEPPAAEAPGIWLSGALANFDLDRWRAVIDRAGAGSGLPSIASIDFKTATLDAFGRRFQDFALTAREQGGNWNGRVASREMAGDVGWRPQGKGQIVARMQRLNLPQPLQRADAVGQAGADEPVGEYPALDVVVEDFAYKDRALGRLALVAVPDGRDWKIQTLELRNPDGRLTADGLWHWQSRAPRTQLGMRLDVSDIGKFLARFGHPEGVRGGTATLSGNLSWAGPPQDLDFPSLTGYMNVEASRGQFAKLDPGIGKLLSILSLQSLPRRVALDFKDVFSEGFAFDEIRGVWTVKAGIANTENFRIAGSAARVVMSGEIDLNRETQKLRVRVTPSLGDSVATLTALLGGPVAGIGVFLAQKLLKDPLGQMVAYDYAVTGTWSDPQVTRVAIERPSEPG
jgi:uncharacterized protein (TIGR02099 family)